MSKIKEVSPILNFIVTNQKDTNDSNHFLPKGVTEHIIPARILHKKSA